MSFFDEMMNESGTVDENTSEWREFTADEKTEREVVTVEVAIDTDSRNVIADAHCEELNWNLEVVIAKYGYGSREVGNCIYHNDQPLRHTTPAETDAMMAWYN